MTSCETGVLQNNPLEAGHDPKDACSMVSATNLKADAESVFKKSYAWTCYRRCDDH